MFQNQDLSFDLVKIAKKSGCRISLGTDSHDPLQLRFMNYATASALKAGVKQERILNFMSAEKLKNWAATVREHHACNESSYETCADSSIRNIPPRHQLRRCPQREQFTP